MKTVQVIDSHTEGEPTRVVVVGGPELGEGSISENVIVLSTSLTTFVQQ